MLWKRKVSCGLTALLGLIMWAGISNSKAGEPAARLVSADYQRVIGTNSHFEAACVGAGRAAELLRKAAVDQLKDVHDHCGFEYLRFHGLFHDEMAVYSENKGTPNYNFQYVDLVYDAILDTGMKPLVELGFMPEATAAGNRQFFGGRVMSRCRRI